MRVLATPSVMLLREVIPTLELVSRASVRAFGTLVESARLAHEARRDHEVTDRRLLHHRRAIRVHGAGRRMCAWQGCDVRVHGTPPNGAVVLVSNHLNWLDPFVFASALPLTGLSKAEMVTWPVVGPASRAVGCIAVQRGDPWSGMLAMRAALRALEAGVPVLNFCEGTTTEGADVLPFRRGIFGLARIVGVPVVPTALRYEPSEACWPSDEVLGRNFLRVARHRRWSAQLHFGAPLQFPLDAPDEVRAMTARAAVRRLAGLALDEGG